MDERLKFIARLLDGEKMAQLCREFGISRKTGYKILTRYNEIGLEGLTDRSSRASGAPRVCFVLYGGYDSSWRSSMPSCCP
jgi:transposase